MRIAPTVEQAPSQGCYLHRNEPADPYRQAGGDLFSYNWEYFVIKRDKTSDKLKTLVECCGYESTIGN